MLEGARLNRLKGWHMQRIENQYEAITGRKPDDAVLQSLLRKATAAGIKENDALLLFFIITEHGISALESVPASIERAAIKAEIAAKERAAAAVSQAVSQAVPQLVAKVDEQVAKVSQATASTQRMKWVASTAGVLALVFCMVAGLGYWIGNKELEVARQEAYTKGSQANVWLQTPEARWAQQAYQNGELSALMNCSRPGWSRQSNGLCIVAETKDGTYGWH